ncbi:transglutaminase superfamily protein [Kineothrix alysoides]|uniref:Transglutaminase superfamily protein n=1 Tax=Kineothrix alysoides TaxID=1469948 RepID=A0A4R1QZR0_9FIRM|nr:transglutaminase domain-containing protein [Kineothrix alysoides]TCL58492.1 transglutaminase superfamily protein [Kineothrix alysoides]
MKYIKKLLYLLLGILSLLSLIIIIGAFNADFSDNLSNFLYAHNILPQAALREEGAPKGLSVSDAAGDRHTYTSDELLRDISEIGKEEAAQEGSYVPPEKSVVEAPARVADKSGYVPVQDTNEQIDDKEAKDLENQLTYGETGDSLTFDTKFYPYYGMLDTPLQKLYRQIYANAISLNGIFTPVEKVGTVQLKNVFMAVFNDHPEIFWLDCAYRGKFSADGICLQIVLQFNETADNLSASETEFDQAAEEILNGARSMGSDYEKEVYVHDTLLDRIRYNLDAPLNQTAYSALVNDQTVCAGYARAFQYLMKQLGVPCYYCTGYAGQNHAWNIIVLDDGFYNVDSTWDDTDPNTYDYFNKTDGDFAATHAREDLSVYLPACNGQKYQAPENNVQTASGSGKRSLEDAGFSPDAVLTGLEDYYQNCYYNIMQSGGSVQFQSVVNSADLWTQCYDSYNSGAYADAYMNQVLSELNASSCQVDIQAEELSGGNILLTHNITVNY